jgi:hypothetical protein
VIAKDWEKPFPYIVTQRIMEQLHPGAIILLHDADDDNIENRSYAALSWYFFVSLFHLC